MLNTFPVALSIGTVLGFLAGIGVGGGSLLILWLTLILNTPYSTARVINLMFFLPAAIISSMFRWRQGALDFKKTLPGIVAGCISAALFAYLGMRINPELLRKLFGVLLLGIGLRELLYQSKN